MVFIRLFFCDVSGSFTIRFQAFYLFKFTKITITTIRNCHQPSHAHAFQNYLYARAHASVLDSLSKYLSSVGRHVVNGS